VLGALTAPMKQIADNGGIDGSVIVDEVSEKGPNIGYNANTGEFADMFKAGVIDPVKVVRTALTNAGSIAGLLLTTEALVTNFEKEDKEKLPVEGVIA
jgi:chaperonin GroEL